jgi:hypothetical protein
MNDNRSTDVTGEGIFTPHMLFADGHTVDTSLMCHDLLPPPAPPEHGAVSVSRGLDGRSNQTVIVAEYRCEQG